MNKNSLVSVIIPVYNAKEYLIKAVDSVLSQTYAPIEVIIINDGSTDGIEKLTPILEEKGTIVISQKNQGAASARNLGIKHATGEYIQFLDADDILHPQKIEKQIKSMKEKDCDLSFSFLVNFTDDIQNSKPYRFETYDFTKLKNGKDILRAYGLDGFFILPNAWLTTRTLVEKAGYWNPYISTNDDAEYFTRILLWSKKVCVVPEVLAYYRKYSNETLSSVNSIERAYSALYSWKLIHALVLATSDPTLLSYPKKGFYHFYHVTRKKYPRIAKLHAQEFDKISAKYPNSNWKWNWLLQIIGLDWTMKLARIKNKITKLLSY